MEAFSEEVLEKLLEDHLMKIPNEILEENVKRCMEDVLKHFQNKSVQDM